LQANDRDLIKINICKIMKFQLSLPKDEQFYNAYAQLTPTLRALGVLAQLVSAATEIGVIYAIIHTSLADFLPRYATHTAIIGAIAATLFIELGLRQFLPHATRAILHRHYTGLHLPMTLFIGTTCAVLLFASGALSFRGSREIVAATAPRPAIATDATALAHYRQDSAVVAERYAVTAGAITERYRAEIAQQWQAMNRIKDKERLENRQYTTAKATIREKIAAIEARAAAELATMATTRGDDLARAQMRLNNARDKVAADNTKTQVEATNKVKNYGLGLGWFSLLALFVLITAVTLEEIARKGAGIETTAQPSQWDFSPGIMDEFLTAINGKWQHHARALINRIAEATPPPPPPANPIPLWDIDPALPRRQKPSQAPPPQNKYTAIIDAALTHASQNTNGKGNATATMAATANDGRHIAFKKTADNTLRYRVADCLYCGRQFEARTTWQVYCSADCRLEYHAARHGGQKYHPKKKYNK
jgi:hypothetical protein